MASQQQWDEKYLQGAIADEIALAAIHPKWRRKFTAPAVPTMNSDLLPAARRGGGNLMSAGATRLTFSTALPTVPPHWRRDWEAAGDLSVELGLTISHDQDDGTVSVGAGGQRRNATERYEDHPSKAAATWAAIVRAATQELEARAGI